MLVRPSACLTERPTHRKVCPPAAVEAPRAGEHDGTNNRVQHQTDPAVAAPPGVSPPVEGVTVFEPTTDEYRFADKVRQPADLAQEAAGQNVVVIAAQLSEIVRGEPKRRTDVN